MWEVGIATISKRLYLKIETVHFKVVDLKIKVNVLKISWLQILINDAVANVKHLIQYFDRHNNLAVGMLMQIRTKYP